MDLTELLSNCNGFDWDKGNLEKNWVKHRVSQQECEQVFFNEPLAFFEDATHSAEENRYFALGRTDLGRVLAVTFTVRKSQIRVISARDMDQKERRDYKSYEKENPSF